VLGEETEPRYPSAYAEVEAQQINRHKLLFSNVFSTTSVMLHREVPYRFSTDQRYAEDYRLWCTMICSGLPGFNIPLCLGFLHKPRYGCSGLSSNLWGMEKNELQNYLHLYREKLISFPMLAPLTVWSFIKYLRRLVTTRLINRNFQATTAGIRPGQENPLPERIGGRES
jgi:hypothetical protein